MTVCRLLDPKDDDRLASVSTFLRRVRQEQGSESDGSPAAREARRAFHASIEERLRTIESGWPDLAVRRSAYLAHRDLTKHPPDIVPVEIRRRIEFAQEVLREYAFAYDEGGGIVTDTFQLWELEREPEAFLRWCRLDDYERHFNDHLALERAKLEERRRRLERAGEPEENLE